MHARKMAVLIVPHRLDDDNDDDNGNDYDDYGDGDDPKLYKRGKTKDCSAAVPTVHVYREPRPLVINRQVLLRPGSESKLFISRTEFETTQII